MATLAGKSRKQKKSHGKAPAETPLDELAKDIEERRKQ
jgi:hypothetical protein